MALPTVFCREKYLIITKFCIFAPNCNKRLLPHFPFQKKSDVCRLLPPMRFIESK